MTLAAFGRGLLNWTRRGQRRRQRVVTGKAPVTQLDDVRALVSALDLSATTTPDELAARLSTVRRRPILIQPYPQNIVAEARRTGEPLPYGVWVFGVATDFIFFREDTTHSHRRHIVLHEIGHIVCRHVGDEACQTDSGEPDHAMITRAVKRAGDFAADQERAAEAFAYLVERHTRPNLSATGETPAARYRLLED